jgi:hypothetical protein
MHSARSVLGGRLGLPGHISRATLYVLGSFLGGLLRMLGHVMRRVFRLLGGMLRDFRCS